jgi:L-lactate dehydrogenase complex protein LldE
MRIALFIPCFNDVLFPGTGVATVRILEKLGHEVVFPDGQTCCGQVHFNTGYRREARRLLRRFLEIFVEAEVVVAPSASCVAMVREQYGVLAGETGDQLLMDAARWMGSRTYELSEFLVGVLGVEELGATFPYRVALHPTCHSTRGIHVGYAPRRLLEGVEGLELVDFDDVEGCCGFGGTFAVKNPHTSLAMMEDKIRCVRESGADVLTAVDNSCLLHLAGGLNRMGFLSVSGVTGGGKGPGVEGGEDPTPGLRVMHVAEILTSGWSGSP